MHRLSYLAAGVLLLATTATAQESVQDRAVYVASANQAMAAARAHAQKTLPDFLKLAAKPPAGTGDYKLKVAITDAHGVEHFWVTPFEAVGTRFRGVISNTPALVRSVEQGQTVDFDRSQISDWGYIRNGRQVGSFTVCVLFQEMSQEEADRYRRDYGFDC